MAVESTGSGLRVDRLIQAMHRTWLFASLRLDHCGNMLGRSLKLIEQHAKLESTASVIGGFVETAMAGDGVARNPARTAPNLWSFLVDIETSGAYAVRLPSHSHTGRSSDDIQGWAGQTV